MYAVGKLGSYITRGVYTVSGPFHPFGGAVDIIVVQQQDGTFKSSPWYVQFGKFQGVLKTKEKIVTISVNGVEAGFHMYLDHKGEAFFLIDADGEEGEFVVSPVSSSDEGEEKMQNGRLSKIQTCDFDGQIEPIAQMDMGNAKILARTTSRRSKIFGLMFGRRSSKGNDKGGNAERITSLERAEIAANLLDVKWSTNLSTGDRRVDNSMGRPSEKYDIHVSDVDKEQSSQVQDSFNLDEATNSCAEDIDISESSFIRSSNLEEKTGSDSPCIRVEEEVIEIHASETSDLIDRTLSTSDQVASNSTFKIPIVDIQSQELSADYSSCIVPHKEDMEGENHFEGITSHEEVVEIYTYETGDADSTSEMTNKLVMLDSDGIELRSPRLASCTYGTIFGERFEDSSVSVSKYEFPEGITSVSYCGSVGSPTVTFNVFTDKGHGTLDLSLDDGLHLKSSSEVLVETNGLISDVRPDLQPDACGGEENPTDCHDQNLDIATIENSHSQNSQDKYPSKGASLDTIAEGSSAESTHDASSELVLKGFHSPISEDLLFSKAGVRFSEKLSGNLDQEKWTCSKDINISATQIQIEERDATEPRLLQPTSNTDEVDPRIMLTFPDSCNSNNQEVQNIRGEVDANKSCFISRDNYAPEFCATPRSTEFAEPTVSLSEILEDIQFPFCDSESSDTKEAVQELVGNDAATGTGDYQLLSGEDDLAEYEADGLKHDKPSEGYSDLLRPHSIPISIPGAGISSEESKLAARSLPNIRSDIHDLERSNHLHPLSCSLNSKHQNYHLKAVKKVTFGSSKLGADAQNVEEGRLAPELAGTVPDAEHEGDQNVNFINPVVELSLCKHLLFEGMGEDAARKAFDSEKVNLEKFRALGPSLVKNDKLIIRISGRYFPWDAAATVVLGMVSFGQEQIFEPQGMIAVDQLEENLKTNDSRTIEVSGGSWSQRIWPFGFKRSRPISTVHTSREGADENVGSTIESVGHLMGENDVHKAKNMKRKVPSLTPSSEELGSLNLKEGPNVVTFSFSTPVLGQQKVDARIYLWKWNTRIVISDVDGTITKSDVLGQFMPLVGVDWSQTGVTHLFSAIKENGYQLLFLSARAISQAHLTRQFLFNLKQPCIWVCRMAKRSLMAQLSYLLMDSFLHFTEKVIRELFPPDCNPFYAGFGNRDTDEISYLKVGIPIGKIFIINPKGEVAVNRRVDTRSYTSLHALVNGMFPPTSSSEQEDYNSWNYWRLPLPEVDL
ncbi:phosphatidate phosphatase PAH2-like isoform X2 [Typha latifolia]|uniref:phosphatidate phosphatase PAH2-like isoform X2 n=1 Tax=Typha latifolia TaxID=4733 RepID=UPI003C2D1033